MSTSSEKHPSPVTYPPPIWQWYQANPEYLQDPSAHRGSLLAVDSKTQQITLYRRFIACKNYPVSTSRYGINNREHSFGTPSGLHAIAKKIGADAPCGEVFIGRRAQGRNGLQNADNGEGQGGEERDTITSRILWLQGLQPGHNSGGQYDSYKRYIYIHGTHAEQKIGTRASNGCIRMKNADVIELFNLSEEKLRVLIY